MAVTVIEVATGLRAAMPSSRPSAGPKARRSGITICMRLPHQAPVGRRKTVVRNRCPRRWRKMQKASREIHVNSFLPLLKDGSEPMSKSVPGSGLFAGLWFHPLVPSLLPGSYVVRDFTLGTPLQPLAETGFTHDVGRYNERRPKMYTTDLFGAAGTHSDGAEERDIQMGVDVGGAANMPIHCFADGTVHSFGYNAPRGDYGYVLVTQHTLGEREVWALHGHLSAESVVGRRRGQPVRCGELLCWTGHEGENGGWPPHIHFQLSLHEPETHDMPGVVSTSQRGAALARYPDPRTVLGQLYPGVGLFDQPTQDEG